jgi:epoxyqueuosine reductase
MNHPLIDVICKEALRLGFVKIGFAEAQPQEEAHKALNTWLAHDYHGTMQYMATHPRHNPTYVEPTTRTVVVVAWPYPKQSRFNTHMPVARYAQIPDYHATLREKLEALATHIRAHTNHAVHTRACVDTAPVLERAWAQQAGVAFFGKSTMGIVAGLGTYVFLGELLIDMPLPPSTPATPKCGSCTACLTACPTQAFVRPYVLDARKCIAYLTIEHKGSIPRELRPKIGHRVYGCDVCQEVCPFNHSPKPAPATPPVLAHLHQLNLVEWLSMGSSTYKKRVKNTALTRASRTQLARNAAVAMGNLQNAEHIPALEQAAQHHTSALVREHATWALGQFKTPHTKKILENLAQNTPHSEVRLEAQKCLEEND